MPEIHPTAVVHPAAEIADDVKIGPFCVVGEHVKLGPGCVLHSHVVIDGPSSFGSGNEFFPFSVIGLKSQDLKYKGEPTYLEVGDNNVFRENATINRATDIGGATRIGNNNLFLVVGAPLRLHSLGQEAGDYGCAEQPPDAPQSGDDAGAGHSVPSTHLRSADSLAA